MKKLMLFAAGAALTSAAPALSQTNTMTDSPSARATWFDMADSNDNEHLSRDEFRDFRFNTASAFSLAYHGYHGALQPIVDRSFTKLDRDSNGMISATEFANAPTLAANNSKPSSASAYGTDSNRARMSNNTMSGNPGMSNAWWDPSYVTATYYMTVNKVDADELNGKPVNNLEGDRVGTIERIVRTRDDNNYYVMIDLDGTTFYTTRRPVAGVPLDDILLYDSGSSVFLSTRGEDHLRNAPAETIEDFETVDTLYQS